MDKTGRQMWRYTWVVPAPGRQKQPYPYEFKDNMIYLMYLRELGLYSETVSEQTGKA